MKKYAWTKATISRWNRKTFPSATTEEQRQKCRQEAREHLAAQTYEERVEELADYYIANGALGYRFGDECGKVNCRNIEDLPNWGTINEAVQRKMDINVRRSWMKYHGEWRHIDGKTA